MKGLLRYSFILFFALFYNVAFSQLHGIYTIGGASPNYATFTAAANDLATQGISGPVIFNARAGTYNEQFTINTYSGASAVNRVTFQSQSGVASDVNINYTAAGAGDDYVIYANGASYLNLKNITVNAIGATYAKALKLNNNAVHDSILNNVLNCGASMYGVNTSMVIDAYSYPGNNDYLVFDGNQVNGGSYAFQMEGGAAVGLEITNNTFTNNAYMAVDLNGSKCAMVRGNTINNPSFGIMIWDGCDGVRVLNNKITAAEGLYIPSAGIPGNEGLIANNFFYTTGYGIYGINTTNQFFYNNSVDVSSSNGYAVYMYGGCSNNILKNNIFYNSAGGNTISISPTGAISASDYNDFYTSGTTLGVMNGTSYSNLAALQTGTGFDAHSNFLLPPFTSGTDLHLTGYTSMRFGTSINSVPVDIDYAERGSTPTVGADDNGTVSSMYSVSSCCGCIQPDFTSNGTSICEGSNVQFSDQTGSSATAWQWIFKGGTPHSSNSQNPLVTYDTTGVYDVTMIVTTTSGTDTVTKSGYIIVNGLPAAGLIVASPDSVCSGSSSQLTVTGSAGTIQWQSSATGVLFSNISSAQSAGYTTPVLTQTTYYRADVTGSCGTDSSAAAMVFVAPVPVAGILSAQPDTLCSGSVARLSSAGVSGNEVQWQSEISGGDYSNIAGADSSSYNTPPLSQTSSYRLIVSNSACADTSASVALVVNPSPVVPTLSTHDSLICTSDSTKIQASGPYTTYLWNDGDTSNYTYASVAGDSWVTVTDGNGCSAVSGHQKISVYPVPSVAIDVLGDTLSSFNANAYQWIFNGDDVPGANSSVYVAHETGNYAVQITDSNGCKTSSTNTFVTINISGISELNENSLLSIYPDPFSSIIFIRSNDATGGIGEIEIYNVLGELIVGKKGVGFSSSPVSLDVSALPGGVYFVVARTGGVEYLKRMVKE